MLKTRYQLGILGAIVLAVFSPSIFAEFCNMDDPGMVAGISGQADWSLKGLFLPQHSGMLYYRPMVILTYFLDKEVWGMHVTAMHLENILLHLVNALLVFFLARHLLPDRLRDRPYLPFFAALLFAIHPVNSESVVWVSGRTDLLAGTFVLLSALLLIRFKLEKNKAALFVGIVSLLLGVLSKETALAFIPGGMFILLANLKSREEQSEFNVRRATTIIKWTIVAVLGFACSVMLFRLLREMAVATDSERIGRALQYMFSDLNYTVFVFLRAFGFYIKKLLWPFPLNFTIIEVDPLYELFAMPIVGLCIYIALRRTLLSGVFTAGIFMITPALPIAFGQIAWTPYAERYVYIASALITPVVTLVVAGWLKDQVPQRRVLHVTLACLLVVMAGAAFQRSLVWQSNLTLFEDTVGKSPNFATAWNEYGRALYLNGEPEEALRQFERARKVYSFAYNQKYDLNMAAVLSDLGRDDEALEVYQRIMKKTRGETIEAYTAAVELLEKKLDSVEDSEDVGQINGLLAEYRGKRAELLLDPPKSNRLWRY